MNDEQFRKIKPTRTLYSAEIIGSSEPEYFLDYKITTVRYLPTDEHYDIVREMFEICDNDPDNVVNWYNEKLVKILEHDLKILDENNADKDSIRYERIQKCRDDTLHFLVKRGRVIPQNILTEKKPEKESGGKSTKPRAHRKTSLEKWSRWDKRFKDLGKESVPYKKRFNIIAEEYTVSPKTVLNIIEDSKIIEKIEEYIKEKEKDK